MTKYEYKLCMTEEEVAEYRKLPGFDGFNNITVKDMIDNTPIKGFYVRFRVAPKRVVVRGQVEANYCGETGIFKTGCNDNQLQASGKMFKPFIGMSVTVEIMESD